MSSHKFLSTIFLGSALVVVIVAVVVSGSLLSRTSLDNRNKAAGTTSAPIGQAESGTAQAVIGAKKVQIIMLKWKAGTGGTTFIPANQTDAATRFTPVRDYVRGQSFGRLTVDNVQYYGWLQTNIPYDNCSTTAWGNFGLSNPIDNWIAQNIPNLPNDHVARIVVMNTPCDSFPRYLYNDRRIRVGPGGFTTAKLEMALGNAFGSGRAAFIQGCPTSTGVVGPACGSIYFGGNMWEPMGNAPQTFTGHNTSFNMWHRRKMGWVVPSEVRYVRNDTGPITIQQMRAPAGSLKTVEVCIDGGRTYSIETRLKQGADIGIIDDNAFKGGIVWLTERNDNDSIWPSEANYPPVDVYRMSGAWFPNTVFNDTTNKIKIIFGARNATTGAQTLTVDYTGTLPVNCPSEFNPPPSPTRTPTKTPTRTPTPVGGPELMKNIGFEADANLDGKPDGWTINANFTRSLTSDPKHSGSHSGKQAPTASSTYSVEQAIPTGIVAGAYYRFSGWFNKPFAADSYSMDVKVVWKNGATVLGETSLMSEGATTQGWVNRITSLNSVKAPATANNAAIKMSVALLNSTFYIDDFSFKRQ